MSGSRWASGCIVDSAAANIAHGNLSPSSWRARSDWEVTWYAMASAVSSCLVLWDLVWQKRPLWLVDSMGTGGMSLVRIHVRVAIGADVLMDVHRVCCEQ